MLLRISLVVAILAGIAAIYFSHVPVQERITTLTSDLETSQNNERSAQQAEQKAKADAKKAREELAETSRNLEEKTATLDSTMTRLSEQEKRANRLDEELTARRGELNIAQQKLNQWEALGLTMDQVRNQKTQYDEVVKERNAFVAENRILLRNNKQLSTELARYTGSEEPHVPLPPGLKGKVLAVDPRYDFVVLDIGGNQGVLEHGQLLVNRDGKLVGKVRVTKVEPNRSIANIIDDWKQPGTEVMEGDLVFH